MKIKEVTISRQTETNHFFLLFEAVGSSLFHGVKDHFKKITVGNSPRLTRSQLFFLFGVKKNDVYSSTNFIWSGLHHTEQKKSQSMKYGWQFDEEVKLTLCHKDSNKERRVCEGKTRHPNRTNPGRAKYIYTPSQVNSNVKLQVCKLTKQFLI